MTKKRRFILIAGFLLISIFAGILYFYFWADINRQAFVMRDEVLYRTANGNEYPVIDQIDVGFEEASTFLDFVKSEDPIVFSSFTLQSPSAPTVEEYVELRKCILQQNCTFLDNRMDISSDIVHSGNQSMRFFTVAPSEEIVSKTCVDTLLLHFVEGDDLWFSAWYYVESGAPTTIADFETSAMKWGPGPRILLGSDQPQVRVELKHANKPVYRQDRDSAVPFPSQQWVHIALHLRLSAGNDGLIEVWQDCEKIIEAEGRNLPKHSAILDRMQVGITATNQETVLFVDDVLLFKEGSPELIMPHCSP
jgi:hypothetical protein